MGFLDYFKQGQTQGSTYRVLHYGQPQQPQQQSQPSASRGRGFPERFELGIPNPQTFHELSQGSADVFAAAGRLPGQITETPVALFDRLVREATGSTATGALSGVPVLSNILGFAGEALERVGNAVPALINAGDMEMLRQFGDKPDDFELPAWSGQRADGVPLLGAIPRFNLLFSRAKTIGELKDELEKRGVLTDPETGERRTWQQVIRALRTGQSATTDFGYAAINDNPLVDLAGRLVTDPTNLLFLVPGANAAKGAQMAGRVAAAGQDAAQAASIVGRIRAPITATASNMVRSGLRAARPPSTIVAREAVATGDVANVTLRGLSSYYADLLRYPASATLNLARAVGQRAVDPRGYLGLIDGPITATSRLGRAGQIAARTGRGYAKSSAALSASMATTGNIAGHIDEALGGQTFFQGFHDFVQDVENDNPLSESAAWMVASAFSFPYGDIVRSGKGGIGTQTLEAFGHDFEPALARMAGFKGRNAVQQLHEALGGPVGAQELVVYLLKHRARREIRDLPMVGQRIGSAPEAAIRAQWSDEALTAKVVELLRENKVSGDDLVEMFQDWHADQMGYRTLEGQQLHSDLRSAPFDPMRAIGDWKRFATAQRGAGAALQVLADGAMGLGLRNHLFAEQFDTIRIRLGEGLRDSDIVPQELIRDVMSDHPALAISDSNGFWKNAALDDAKPVTWGSVRRKLADQAIDAPRLADELGPLRTLEDGADRTDAPGGFEDADAHVQRIADELEQHRAPGDVLYHGSSQEGLTVLSGSRRGSNLDNATSEFGVFLTPDRIEAQRYADMGGTPGVVYETTARPQNPYRMSRREFTYFQDLSRAADGSPLQSDAWAGRMEELKVEARTRRAELEAEGFDGIEVAGSSRGAAPEIASFADVPVGNFLQNDRSIALQDELSGDLARRGEAARARRVAADEAAFGSENAQILRQLDSEVPDLTLDPTTHFFDAEQRAIAQEIERNILEIDPTYTVKALPKNDVLVQMRQTDPALYQMVRARTLLGELLFDRGPIAPMTGFVKALLRPVKGDRRARAARQALYQKLIPHGAKPSTVDQWLAKMQEQAEMHYVTVRGLKYHKYRDASTLPTSVINRLAREAFGENSKVVQQFDGRFHDVLDMAGSDMWRAVRAEVRKGGRKGQLARALEAWGEFYREGPGISAASDLGRAVGKTYYHWFRFMLDPRWHAMNLMERNFLGGVEDGILRTNRQLSRSSQFYLSGARRPLKAVDQAKIDSAGRRLRAGKITPEQFDEVTRGLSVEPMVDALDSGWYYGRGLEGWIARSFDERRIESTQAALDGLADENVAMLGTMRDRLRREAEFDLKRAQEAYAEGRITADDLGRMEELANLDIETSNASLAELLDDKMYRFDQDGVRATLQDEAARLLDEQEMQVLQPLLDVLYERNEQLWQDVNRLYHGNPQRSTLERIANSYWLYWPISYQIKTVKWLARVMLDGSFGHDNNALLAGVYSNWHDQHQERMENNPAYAAMFKENPDLWFAAQMLLPMTPDGMGISLSRPVRVAGDWLGLFNDYQQAQSPLSAATYITNLGPIYTWHLLQEIDRELKPDEETE